MGIIDFSTTKKYMSIQPTRPQDVATLLRKSWASLGSSEKATIEFFCGVGFTAQLIFDEIMRQREVCEMVTTAKDQGLANLTSKDVAKIFEHKAAGHTVDAAVSKVIAEKALVVNQSNEEATGGQDEA